MRQEALTTDVTTETNTLRDLGVTPEIADALEAVGVVTPFPIQSLALPLALDGHDVIGQARTGTGKTYAFGVPLLQRIRAAGPARPGKPHALVVAPTRELAMQVTGDLTTAGTPIGASVLVVYGGRSYEPQIEGLRQGADVVVGTPGRLLDLAGQGYLDLSEVSMLVLDEADKMLDLGFLPDIERILKLTPSHRQTMLFSATMPGEVVTLSRRYLNRPTHVRGDVTEDAGPPPTTAQHVFRTHKLDKPEMLARMLQTSERGLTMVFCATKRTADQLASDMSRRGFAAAAVHGDLGQGQREQAMRAFRSGKVDVLLATDVAARGLDVDDVTHVVNYECPEDEKAYVHRVGRTGRAGRLGIAVTFVDWEDVQRWKVINTALDLPFAEPPETYSTSDHLYAELEIPGQVTGTLPHEQRKRAGLNAEKVDDLGETGNTRSRRRSGAGETGAQRTRRGGRSRRRTRAGQPVERQSDETPTQMGGSPAPGTAGKNGAAANEQATSPDTAGASGSGRPRRQRRRRRTRGGQQTNQAGQTQ